MRPPLPGKRRLRQGLESLAAVWMTLVSPCRHELFGSAVQAELFPGGKARLSGLCLDPCSGLDDPCAGRAAAGPVACRLFPGPSLSGLGLFLSGLVLRTPAIQRSGTHL